MKNGLLEVGSGGSVVAFAGKNGWWRILRWLVGVTDRVSMMKVITKDLQLFRVLWVVGLLLIRVVFLGC